MRGAVVNALISGRAGLAIAVTGDALWMIRAGAPDKKVTIRPEPGGDSPGAPGLGHDSHGPVRVGGGADAVPRHRGPRGDSGPGCPGARVCAADAVPRHRGPRGALPPAHLHVGPGEGG